MTIKIARDLTVSVYPDTQTDVGASSFDVGSGSVHETVSVFKESDKSGMFEQFKNIPNNEAYKMAFADRMMLRDPANPYNFIGNTHRADFIPPLKMILDKLDPKSPRIFDVGAGSGEIVDILISKLPSATLSIEEPNPFFLNEYLQRIENFPHLQRESVYSQPIQQLYGTIDQSYDLILAIHMIYFLSNFKSRDSINASEDIIKFVSFLYGLLPQNGKLFLVYADQLRSTAGMASKYYFSHRNEDAYIANNLNEIWNAREHLLKEGHVSGELNNLHPQFRAEVESFTTDSYLYGKTLEDIIIMCICGELGSSDNAPFDARILDVCADFVNKHKTEIGLVIESNEVPQKGMYRCNQPQVVCTITKRELA